MKRFLTVCQAQQIHHLILLKPRREVIPVPQSGELESDMNLKHVAQSSPVPSEDHLTLSQIMVVAKMQVEFSYKLLLVPMKLTSWNTTLGCKLKETSPDLFFDTTDVQGWSQPCTHCPEALVPATQ